MLCVADEFEQSLSPFLHNPHYIIPREAQLEDTTLQLEALQSTLACDISECVQLVTSRPPLNHQQLPPQPPGTACFGGGAAAAAAVGVAACGDAAGSPMQQRWSLSAAAGAAGGLCGGAQQRGLGSPLAADYCGGQYGEVGGRGGLGGLRSSHEWGGGYGSGRQEPGSVGAAAAGGMPFSRAEVAALDGEIAAAERRLRQAAARLGGGRGMGVEGVL